MKQFWIFLFCNFTPNMCPNCDKTMTFLLARIRYSAKDSSDENPKSLIELHYVVDFLAMCYLWFALPDFKCFRHIIQLKLFFISLWVPFILIPPPCYRYVWLFTTTIAWCRLFFKYSLLYPHSTISSKCTINCKNQPTAPPLHIKLQLLLYPFWNNFYFFVFFS